MALLSTFELLVKPIAPAGSGPASVARTVVQGYFLTIANTSEFTAAVTLLFTVTTPDLDINETVVVNDVDGNDGFSPLNPIAPNKFTTYQKIPANDTALVTLLPNLNKLDLSSPKLELRGYVEIFLNDTDSPNRIASVNLLLTPEHRGTFLPQNLKALHPDFDQLAYALPTSTGGSLFTLTVPVP